MHIPAELIVIKTMRIAEMRIVHTESERLLVHRIDECIVAILRHLVLRNALVFLKLFQDLRPERFSQGLTCIVAGRDHERLDRSFEREHIACPQPRSGFTDARCLLADRDLGLRRVSPIVERNERGHDLRDGCDVNLIVSIACEIDRAIAGNEIGVFGDDIRCLSSGEALLLDGLTEHHIGIAHFSLGDARTKRDAQGQTQIRKQRCLRIWSVFYQGYAT